MNPQTFARLAAVSALALCLSAPPLHGQRVLDWPVRTDARPEALIGGAAAAFWNPARSTAHGGSIEVLVIDLAAPDALGLGAVGAAVAARPFGAVSVTAGYQHTTVGDMTRTDGPPLEGGGLELEIGEDVFSLGVAAPTGMGWTLGAAARFIRASAELGGGSAWQGALGVVYAHELEPFELRAAGMGLVGGERLRLNGALEVEPRWPEAPFAASLAWGLAEREALGVAHRLMGRVVWRELVEGHVGLAGEPGESGRTWQPTLAALLHLGRYTAGVVREDLPNDFGGVLHYRLSIEF